MRNQKFNTDDVIGKVRSLRKEGMTWEQVTATLNDAGLKTPTRKKWSGRNLYTYYRTHTKTASVVRRAARRVAAPESDSNAQAIGLIRAVMRTNLKNRSEIIGMISDGV